ncbi:MAG TPA: LD-carboxypeptidase [Thermoanaerobaculia bacterium]|nr:LD-carboxypeptidase [Thermoanaerobaculia bacterium]
MLIFPRALPPHAHIAVCAISGSSKIERVRIGAEWLESRGYRVSLAANIDHAFRDYLAGPDDERVAELNHYLRSDAVDAVFFSRGGYGAMRVLDRIDYDAIRRNPRPIVGFSDITALHNAVALRAGVASFHGPMLNLDFADGLSDSVADWFFALLRGEAPLTHRFGPEQVLSDGDAEGVLFGGCLSLTTSLTATPYDFWIDDGIWFWEDVGEEPYRLDRMLTHLDLSGRLQRIRAVVIGKLKGCGSEPEVATLLRETFGSRGIPVVRDLPFGHFGDNLLMPIGAPVRVNTSDGTFTVTAPAVQR